MQNKIMFVDAVDLAQALLDAGATGAVVFLKGQEALAQHWLNRGGTESLLDTQRSLQQADLPLVA